MLGSTLLVTNISKSEQILDIQIDSENEKYYVDQIRNEFKIGELPYQLDQQDPSKSDLEENEYATSNTDVVNSEKKDGCWFIENPVSKELTKSLKLKLGPQCEMEFIIVVRSPVAQKPESLMSFINIKLSGVDEENNDGEQDEETDGQSNYFVEKQIKSGGILRESIKKLPSAQHRMRVMVTGKVDPPSLICQRQVFHGPSNANLIPIALKKNTAC